jgi:hypothetical protein
MSSTFSNLKFELIGNGEQSGTWGTTTNSNIGTAIEQAIVGMATLSSGDFTANVATLTLANTTAAQNARALCLNIASGAVSAAGTINVPAIQKPYLIINGSSFTVTVKVSGQTGVAVPAGTRTVVYNNGTDVGAQVSWLGSLTLGTALPIASGGTGSTSTTFVNLATNVTGTLPIANGGTGSTSTTFVNLATNVTGTLPVANGGTGLTATPANGQLDIGNGTGFTRAVLTAGSGISVTNSAGGITIASTVTPGTGTVTSVGGTGTVNGITLTGTVTSTGNLTLGGALSGVNLTSQVTGTLPVANGGTGATTLTGLTIPQAVLAQPVITQNVQVIGTNTTAVASRIYVLTASLTLDLPASPSAGNWVGVSNMSGAITATIGRNSQPIMALAENLTVDLDGAGFTLVYADATRGWVLLP